MAVKAKPVQSLHALGYSFWASDSYSYILGGTQPPPEMQWTDE